MKEHGNVSSAYSLVTRKRFDSTLNSANFVLGSAIWLSNHLDNGYDAHVSLFFEVVVGDQLTILMIARFFRARGDNTPVPVGKLFEGVVVV